MKKKKSFFFLFLFIITILLCLGLIEAIVHVTKTSPEKIYMIGGVIIGYIVQQVITIEDKYCKTKKEQNK